MDIWSLGVTLAELFTGNVLFPGRTNNDMLRLFMDLIGCFSNKMIRRHITSYSTKLGLQPHFEASAGNYNFRRADFDKVTRQPVIRIITDYNSSTTPSKQIVHVLLNVVSKSDERGEVIKFADFLSRILALDPGKRMGVDMALTHELFAKKKHRKRARLAQEIENREVNGKC